MRFVTGLICGLAIAAVAYVEWGTLRPVMDRVVAELGELPHPAARIDVDEGIEGAANQQREHPPAMEPVKAKPTERDRMPPEIATEAPLPTQTLPPGSDIDVAGAAPVSAAPLGESASPEPDAPAVSGHRAAPRAGEDWPANAVLRTTATDATAQQPSVPAGAATVEPREAAGGTAVIWQQFRSEVTARGFAGFVARRTGRTFEVQPQALGQYAVVYRYTDAADLAATRAAVDRLAGGGVAL